MPAQEILERSRRIENLLFDSTFWAAAHAVYCYVSLPREVQTAGIRKRAYLEGKLLALPRVEGEDLQFHLVSDPAQPLVRSSLNIEEPPADLPSVAPAPEPTRLGRDRALVLVPGLAFDRECHRLGRGRGFYDRFLRRYRQDVVAIGLCLERQLVDGVPRDNRDMRVDAVVTEERTIRA
mgnify:CR=1 FL=1